MTIGSLIGRMAQSIYNGKTISLPLWGTRRSVGYRRTASARKAMLVIGLTGSIGTGKSEVARLLQALGAVIIDADLVGHEAYQAQY